MTTHTLRSKRRGSALRTAAFMSPWLIGFGVFFAYPMVSTVYFSFTKYDGFGAPSFNGLTNWTYVFTDYPMFWPSLLNTLWLVLVMVTCRVVFGLGTGLLITRIKTGTGLFRTFFYLPYLAPPVAATLAFVFLLNPGTGPVNSVLGDLGLPTPGWFNDASWSKPALTMLAVWGIGDLMVIFMAALLDVPTEQYEAAELDGASAWQRFRFVTLPNISPIVLFAVVTGVIQAMQYYTQPLVAGKVASGVIGGSGQQFEPGYPDKSTLTLPQLVYNLGFQRFDYGSACVVALVLFALAMAFTALLMRGRNNLIQAGD
ncbi:MULTISPECIES: sugar ABC transporter permease [unclassified Streptomyces]|uniref:carbohydrate ABC transporter permease n=1 Tax=Streptomyces TaxID=1883 RepID=UPI0001C1D030|nr:MULTISPECIES: sugar ABC transporter permease [unclassified Streptomyces]AEN09986.1 binding-protein-dependent transport systems inner membrane component [Streptomyces sp. SirexAA-E]MYR67615.1 ABC transporter permease subunit [Streptomyces sp. SID4939]MYS00421.1 ABC transporter permease subunit [Streptomyces sp. SID4940]MYT65011.1 ABC transporter permease subunit [Streptomyces sp. SID8357]MYT88974.1 ABC transporter permease subunit [Streptomyces sp. SID8360]